MFNTDLTDPNLAYILGLFQTDGSLSGKPDKKGKFQIELNKDDITVLKLIQDILPFESKIRERVRDTNFKDGAASAILYFCKMEYREWINKLGVPYGRKSSTIEVPKVEFSAPDYFRGLIDGDGSLGITQSGKPFVSLTTKSDSIKDGFIKYVSDFIGYTKECSKNARDDIYNISLFSEIAQSVISDMYYDGCLCLERKMKSSRQVMEWIRPSDFKKVNRGIKWSLAQDEVVLSNSVENAADILNRSCSSIKNRKFRLRHVTI